MGDRLGIPRAVGFFFLFFVFFFFFPSFPESSLLPFVFPPPSWAETVRHISFSSSVRLNVERSSLEKSLIDWSLFPSTGWLGAVWEGVDARLEHGQSLGNGRLVTNSTVDQTGSKLENTPFERT